MMEIKQQRTAASFSTAVVVVFDAWINATMKKWICHIQKTPRNIILHNFSSFKPPETSDTPSLEVHTPLSELTRRPIFSNRPPPLLQSNSYVLPPTDLSYHLDVKNPQIHSMFKVAIEAALGTTSNTIPMYYENLINSFPTLSFSYVNASPTTLGAIVQSDLSLRRMIGTARHNRGLYLLDDNASSSSISRTSLSSSYFSTFEKDL
ncbi:kirola-like [Cucumis melo var. makuwa]|uniref:Kirola-like n=1 Tax=Cucumis melo var. makuwa TaxID=1194695 RepID=A0A5D3DEH6_CUCMM|nr:kirola-like [Cucumis melo var. makuwa]TYK22077.1 kirola-like [Cucumis melo var. makuwa]